MFPSITTCIYSKKIQEATASTTENGWLRQFEVKQFRNHCDHCTSQSLRNCIPSKSTPEQQVAQPMQKLAVLLSVHLPINCLQGLVLLVTPLSVKLCTARVSRVISCCSMPSRTIPCPACPACHPRNLLRVSVRVN